MQAGASSEGDSDSSAQRAALRRRLLAARQKFAAEAPFVGAAAALTAHLARLLRELEPTVLGTYWPVRGEFDPCDAVRAAADAVPALALPYAQREPRAMHYRRWNGTPPEATDECGLPAPQVGAIVVPDVVLVPCVGFTRAGARLGYGGGYFDRWLAQHPHVTAVGVAWSASEIAAPDWQHEPHDQSLAVIVTEGGVVA